MQVAVEGDENYIEKADNAYANNEYVELEICIMMNFKVTTGLT